MSIVNFDGKDLNVHPCTLEDLDVLSNNYNIESSDFQEGKNVSPAKIKNLVCYIVNRADPSYSDFSVIASKIVILDTVLQNLLVAFWGKSDNPISS